MQITDYLILFSSVMFGGSLFFLLKNPGRNLLKLMLSFSGAFLFAITVTHLMPEVYADNNPRIGLWIMIGFFIQIILELFSQGIEHGHVHVHKNHSDAFPLSMMISLCLHSFLEGMPLSSISENTSLPSHNHSLLIGIALHHIPVAFALVSMLIASKIGNFKTILYLAIFALMGPLGAFTSASLNIGLTSNFNGWYHQIMAIVIGIFLHISTTILFETSSDHRFNLYKMATILAGGCVGIMVS